MNIKFFLLHELLIILPTSLRPYKPAHISVPSTAGTPNAQV